MDDIAIRPIRLPLEGLDALRRESLEDGFDFVERLATEWDSGVNRFDRPGECLLGAFAGERLVSIAGLNRDPYAQDAQTGRLRHVYVLEAWRRHGIGAALVRRLLEAAQGRFARLRLRTERAGPFYLRLGFSPSPDPDATHVRPTARRQTNSARALPSRSTPPSSVSAFFAKQRRMTVRTGSSA